VVVNQLQQIYQTLHGHKFGTSNVATLGKGRLTNNHTLGEKIKITQWVERNRVYIGDIDQLNTFYMGCSTLGDLHWVDFTSYSLHLFLPSSYLPSWPCEVVQASYLSSLTPNYQSLQQS
jgi:hypothetical protein